MKRTLFTALALLALQGIPQALTIGAHSTEVGSSVAQVNGHVRMRKKRAGVRTIPPSDLHCHIPRRVPMRCHRGLVYDGPR